jgi:hypothetical protein
MTEDFSNHTVSIGEAKAAKHHDAALWTPRDVLIKALREIDSGEIKPDHVMLVFATVDVDGDTEQTYFRSVPSTFYSVDMLSAAIHDTFRKDSHYVT